MTPIQTRSGVFGQSKTKPTTRDHQRNTVHQQKAAGAAVNSITKNTKRQKTAEKEQKAKTKLNTISTIGIQHSVTDEKQNKRATKRQINTQHQTIPNTIHFSHLRSRHLDHNFSGFCTRNKFSRRLAMGNGRGSTPPPGLS